MWDVLKGEGLANYRGHNGRVMSVVWSIIDADVVFSGGEDFTVRCWRISQQRFKEPPVEGKIKNHLFALLQSVVFYNDIHLAG